MVALGHLDDAYEMFMTVGDKYTKTYLVDIAEMIIDHGYRPSDLGNKDPNEYVIELLSSSNSAPKSGGSKRTRATFGGYEANLESIGRPQFLTSKPVQKRRDALLEQALQIQTGEEESETILPRSTATTTRFSGATQSIQSRSSSRTED